MDDVRGHVTPVETGIKEKIVAALIVAVGFGAIGAYAYESGAMSSQIKQVAAVEQVAPPAPQPTEASSVVPPPQATAALPSPLDLPLAPAEKAPAKNENARAQTPSQAAPTPPVRVARAQAPTPSIQAPSPVSAEAAPAETIPAQPAPQGSIASPPANAPQDAPAPEAVEQPTTTPPAQ
jgi:hypothetical protein